MDALVSILKNEGLRGLYKGYYATVLSFGPFSALYFSFHEKVIIYFFPSVILIKYFIYYCYLFL